MLTLTSVREGLIMATIKDIAQKAGVSMMTVSRAINSPEKVKDEIRDQILAIAKELQYRPNQAARALATRKTGIIQVVVRSSMQANDPYFMRLFVGIADYLSEFNYSIQICRGFDHQNRSDGVIAMGLKDTEDQELYKKAKVPCVLFGKTDLPMDWVDIDNKGAVMQGVEYLIKQGHKSIGFVALDIPDHYARERLEGYRTAMKESSLSIEPSWIIHTMDTKEAGMDAAKALLTDSTLTAIVCSTDVLAIGVLEATKQMKIEVPNQLSIVGMDGIYLDQIVFPHLTTVQQPVYQIGKELAKMLLDRLNNPEKPAQNSIIDVHLLLQGTTK